AAFEVLHLELRLVRAGERFAPRGLLAPGFEREERRPGLDRAAASGLEAYERPGEGCGHAHELALDVPLQSGGLVLAAGHGGGRHERKQGGPFHARRRAAGFARRGSPSGASARKARSMRSSMAASLTSPRASALPARSPSIAPAKRIGAAMEPAQTPIACGTGIVRSSPVSWACAINPCRSVRWRGMFSHRNAVAIASPHSESASTREMNARWSRRKRPSTRNAARRLCTGPTSCPETRVTCTNMSSYVCCSSARRKASRVRKW